MLLIAGRALPRLLAWRQCVVALVELAKWYDGGPAVHLWFRCDDLEPAWCFDQQPAAAEWCFRALGVRTCDAHRYLLVELDELASLLGDIEIDDGCTLDVPLLLASVIGGVVPLIGNAKLPVAITGLSIGGVVVQLR